MKNPEKMAAGITPPPSQVTSSVCVCVCVRADVDDVFQLQVVCVCVIREADLISRSSSSLASFPPSP